MSLNDACRDIKEFAYKLHRDSFLYPSRDEIPFLNTRQYCYFSTFSLCIIISFHYAYCLCHLA